MPHSANQYNYATPLSSTTGLVSDRAHDSSVKYFTLFDNVLDGSYLPVSGDAGIWGSSVANSDGTLPTPFVLTVTGTTTLNAFRLISSSYGYPVAFTVQFYNNSNLVYTITETANASAVYIKYLPVTVIATRYVVTVTKVSNGVARLYSVYNPGYVKRNDTALLTVTELNLASQQRYLRSVDTLSAKIVESRPYIHNTIEPTFDVLHVDALPDGTVTNVHTRMKDMSRRVYGKVYVTYTDPLLDSETVAEASSTAYNSNAQQVVDGARNADALFFTLYDNDLSGRYSVMSEHSHVGWHSKEVSDSNGNFTTSPSLTVRFSYRPITSLVVWFDDSHGSVAKDFTVDLINSSGVTTRRTFVNNTKAEVLVNDTVLADIVAVTITVSSVTKPGMPVGILEIPVFSTFLYEGYQDISKLISMDLLEELTYDDNVEALGGISANKATIVFDNSNNDFYFNNRESAIATQLRRNRRIEPWLGVEINPGEIEWYKQGVFWSYSWDVPVKSLTAKVIGFDTIGLLDTTSFTAHYVLVNKSLGELLDVVLSDAKQYLSSLEWKIDAALYDIVIPYAWFEPGSHTAALRKISKAYPMHVYCDRNGVICAAPQKLHVDFYYDTWSDSTNVFDKKYSSLYTTLPNIVNVTVNIPVLVDAEELAQDSLVFDVAAVPTRTLNFNKPYLSNLTVTVDKDASVSYTYTAYSWGIVLDFTGYGEVRSIRCIGTAVDTSNTSVLTRRNNESIRLDGAITRDVAADFIQTGALATLILDRIFTLSSNDKYDASVDYRGDISLSINDPILLLDGIAPDNRYNIRRHQLSWNGALTGNADLNT